MDSNELLKTLKKINTTAKNVYVLSADEDEIKKVNFTELPCFIVSNCCTRGEFVYAYTYCDNTH